jgi:hypothetical protein
MKAFALPVAMVATLLLTNHAHAQSGIRYVAMGGGRPAAKPTTKAPARLTSQVVSDEESSYLGGDIGTGGYVAGGDPSYGARGVSTKGYYPDFGVVPGGMSVWPGVPACCDPWLGYCGEPRCNHCSCGRGRYLYMRCSKETCTPELVSWGGKCSKCNQCGNCGTCATCGTCTTCGEGANMSYTTQPTSAPQPVAEQPSKTKVQAVPEVESDDESTAKKSPPRNKLPKIPLPSALGKSDWFRK